MTAPFLFFGVGSLHDDDQVGWLVAQAVSRRNQQDCEVRIASSPADLLEPFSDRACLLICDACRANSSIGSVHRLAWPSSDLLKFGWSGTHDLELPEVLQLASKLDWLPERVVVWGVEIGSTNTGPVTIGSGISEVLNSLIDSIADQAISEFARMVSLIHPPSTSSASNIGRVER